MEKKFKTKSWSFSPYLLNTTYKVVTSPHNLFAEINLEAKTFYYHHHSFRAPGLGIAVEILFVEVRAKRLERKARPAGKPPPKNELSYHYT